MLLDGTFRLLWSVCHDSVTGDLEAEAYDGRTKEEGAFMIMKRSFVLLILVFVLAIGYSAQPHGSVTAITDPTPVLISTQEDPTPAAEPTIPAATETVSTSPQAPEPASQSPLNTASGIQTVSATAADFSQGLPYTPSVWPDYAPARQIPVIEYSDGVSYVSPDGKWEMKADWFRDQIFWLKQNGFRAITPKELISFLNFEIMPPQGSIVLKFLTNAHTKRSDFTNVIIPILKETAFHGNLFVAYENISDTCDSEKLCWPELIEWQNQGILTVGSEGLNDYNDYWNCPEAAKPVAEKSKQLIEQKTGKPVFFMAFNSERETTAWYYPAEVGYQAAFDRRKIYREQSQIQMTSVRFGDYDRYALPSYMPYSSEKTYPLTMNFVGETQISFRDLMWKAIGASAPDMTTFKTTDPSAADRAKAWDTVFNYCSGGTRRDMSGGQFLDKIPFFTNVSIEAQKELNGFVDVRPTCYFIANNSPRFIVLHYTEGTLAEAVNTFRGNKGVAAHYIVDVDGTVTQLVPENFGTFHASCSGSEKGACVPACAACKSQSGGFKEPYLQSIGIEIVNPGPVIKKGDFFFDAYKRMYFGPVLENPAPTDGTFLYKYQYWGGYTDQQMSAVKTLVNDIESRWPIEGVVGHSDVQFKVDPGPALETFLQVLNGEASPSKKAPTP